MSRIAYILSAYKDATHLARLVNALDENADFYVHVDLKSDIQPFEKLLKGKVTFVPRHWTSWGGWEQVEYQKELLGAVLQSKKDYGHVVCLSGQDYPLWSNKKIHQFFDQHPTTEYISGINLTHCENLKQRHKITRYHLFRDLPWKNLWLKNKCIVTARWIANILPIRKQPIVYINHQPCDVYLGSDYWAVTLPCARHIYHTLCHETALVRYFQSSFVPSELCIQTIVFNSPFAAKAQHYKGTYPGLAKLTPLHYIDYGASIKELTEADLPTLTKSKKMFCRKTVTGLSDSLMNHIDQILRIH